ncbi:MAG: hypothetical protein ABIH70_01495 [Chloroflexota bacterium]
MTTFDFERYCATCIDYLFFLLARHQPFCDRLEELRQEYSLLLKDHSWSEIGILKSREDPPLSLKQDCTKAKEYSTALSQLVKEYGLNPDWAIDRLNYGIVYPKALVIGPISEADTEHREYTITWNTWSLPTKKSIEQDIFKQFEKQWSEYERSLEEFGYIRTRRHGSFGIHMRWVFKRVCLKQSWNQIAKEEASHPDTIRHAVESISKKLGLTLPKIKGGRPKKR